MTNFTRLCVGVLTPRNKTGNTFPLLRSAYGTYRCRIRVYLLFLYLFSPGGTCFTRQVGGNVQQCGRCSEMLGCDDRKSTKEALGDD